MAILSHKMLSLLQLTKLKPIKDDNVPDVLSNAVKLEKRLDMEIGDSADVSGILYAIEGTATFNCRDGKPRTRQNISIIDDSKKNCHDVPLGTLEWEIGRQGSIRNRSQ